MRGAGTRRPEAPPPEGRGAPASADEDKLREDIFIKPFLPYRLELVNGTDLVQRLKEYTTPKGR